VFGEALACLAPRRSGELDRLRAIAHGDTGVKAVAEDGQHRTVLRKHLGYEPGYAVLFRHACQALDEDRPKTPIVQMIGDLNRDFRARIVELEIESMTDEHASLIVGE